MGLNNIINVKSPTNLNWQRAVHNLFYELLKRHRVEILLLTSIESIRRACGKRRSQIRIVVAIHDAHLADRATLLRAPHGVRQRGANKLKHLVNSVGVDGLDRQSMKFTNSIYISMWEIWPQSQRVLTQR